MKTTKPARLDADRSAKPRTRLVQHARPGDAVGPGRPLREPEYEDGSRVALAAAAEAPERRCVRCECRLTSPAPAQSDGYCWSCGHWLGRRVRGADGNWAVVEPEPRDGEDTEAEERGG